MSKAIIFSDLHIHNYQNFNKKADRLENCLKVLDDIFHFAAEREINTVIFGGDLFDTPKVLTTIVMNKAVDRFIQLFKGFPDITFYAITGNHDQGRKNLPDSPAEASNEYIASVFPDRFILFDNKTIRLSECVTLTGIPYYEHSEHYQAQLEKMTDGISEHDYNYLFIHQTPYGIGNKMIPTDTDPTDVLYGSYNHVYCGHIHKRMQLTESFTVIGSPIHRDFGDVGEKKGFLVVNLEKPEKRAVFIPLEGYPEFKTRYEDEQPLETEPVDFVLVKPIIPLSTDSDSGEGVDVAKFSTALPNEEILENYWKEVDGKDEELLQLGLQFIQ